MVKIEAGKFYRTRDGEKVGPMIKFSYGDDNFIVEEGDVRVWKQDGTFRKSGFRANSGDIISEWTEAQKFKVGDRVRFTDQTPIGWWVKPGMEGVVAYVVNGGGFHVRIDGRGVAGTTGRYIEPAPEPVFTLDWPHGHVTRDGRKARIVCTDVKGAYPIIALISEDPDEWVRRYSDMGVCQSRCDSDDLINAPAPKREWWVNVYGTAPEASYAYSTRATADFDAKHGRLACVHVTEGDGL